MMGSSDLQNWTVSWGRISASLSEYYLLCFCYYQIARKMSREPILLQQFGARYFLQGYEVDTQNFCQLIGFYEENRDKQWGVLCVYEIAVEGAAHVNLPVYTRFERKRASDNKFTFREFSQISRKCVKGGTQVVHSSTTIAWEDDEN